MASEHTVEKGRSGRARKEVNRESWDSVFQKLCDKHPRGVDTYIRNKEAGIYSSWYLSHWCLRSAPKSIELGPFRLTERIGHLWPETVHEQRSQWFALKPWLSAQSREVGDMSGAWIMDPTRTFIAYVMLHQRSHKPWGTNATIIRYYG